MTTEPVDFVTPKVRAALDLLYGVTRLAPVPATQHDACLQAVGILNDALKPPAPTGPQENATTS